MGADNVEHTPYVVHRALLGSLERFMGILIEHYGGAFPTWLAPVQVRVLPVADAHRDEARALVDALGSGLVRADLDEREETLGKRIRDAELQKIPYVVVWGDRETRDAMAVRARGGEGVTTMSLDALVAEIAERSPS
jgi:threonyl-tRNA synthetase